MIENGIILHCDQGSQYTSKAFIEFCESVQVTQSMSKPQSRVSIRQCADGKVFQHHEEWRYKSVRISDRGATLSDSSAILIRNLQPCAPIHTMGNKHPLKHGAHSLVCSKILSRKKEICVFSAFPDISRALECWQRFQLLFSVSNGSWL